MITEGHWEVDRKGRVIQTSSGGIVAECANPPDAIHIAELRKAHLLKTVAPDLSGELKDLRLKVQEQATEIMELKRKLDPASEAELARREIAKAEKAAKNSGRQ